MRPLIIISGVLRVLAVLFVFALYLYGQEACDHISDSKARFDAIHLTPPVAIKSLDWADFAVVYEDKFGIYAESFTADKDTVMPDDIARTYKLKNKRFWILYCDCRHIYTIAEVLPTQIKNNPKR